MQTTLAAINLIKEFEGFRPHAYLDPLGVPTIGYGTTIWSDGLKVQLGDSIGHDEAERELFTHVRKEVEPTLTRLFGDLPLQVGQRDALASFIYNLGPDADKKYPTLVSLVRSGAGIESIARQLVKYRNKGSSAEEGLHRRRVAEALMFAGLNSEHAKNVELDDDVMDVLVKAGLQQPLPKGYEGLSPNEQTEWLNKNESAKIKGEPAPPITPDVLPGPPAIKPALKVQQRVNKVAIGDVPYIENPTPSVKRIEDSQRGKGYAKSEAGKNIGSVAVIGTASTAVGAMEPVVRFVDKYPKDTIAMVFVGLLIFGVIYYYYGQWQRQKGEDEAEDYLA